MTFSGRLRHFFDVVDPRTLFTSEVITTHYTHILHFTLYDYNISIAKLKPWKFTHTLEVIRLTGPGFPSLKIFQGSSPF